ncbi:bifunctional 2-polyprenyl-6-hydroxyphenol methylase/3-demethylubiquinol 3-O-methyltransferase UbiG [Babesia caballi]|uniref:Ubiquinone biosynthesis O-methyltransferase, mitochondrial n=1 Tax=Babesia caballi TaxID=5871 RepID=A0AAV4LVE1_BABCB|nr:bifunctional 2-polyprenyl-6-hydroxyphenol methylase/3-demethylubiquinol 3-O-methyltransferase UbiG [Babesia caballi]
MLCGAASTFSALARRVQTGRPARSFSSSGHFGAFGEGWWDIDGPMSVLHDYNYVRVPFIAKSYGLLDTTPAPKPRERDTEATGCLANRLFRHAEERSKIHLEASLGGLRILDVGCGGGILSESLAKCGAHVLGIDPSDELIRVAESHRLEDFATFSQRIGVRDDRSNNVRYLATTLEDYAAGPEAARFDIVVASEVLEHVANSDKQGFIARLSQLARPGGLVVFTTPGRTLKSCLVNIFLAEQVFRRVPPRTHQYSLFISPEALCGLSASCGLREIHRQGVFYLPFSRRFMHLPTCDFLYMIAFKTPE